MRFIPLKKSEPALQLHVDCLLVLKLVSLSKEIPDLPVCGEHGILLKN